MAYEQNVSSQSKPEIDVLLDILLSETRQTDLNRGKLAATVESIVKKYF